MKQFKILFALAGLTFGTAAGIALAHADEPTVTLTQAELQAFVNAQLAATQAQSAIKKVQGAFTPPASPPTTTAHPVPAGEPGAAK